MKCPHCKKQINVKTISEITQKAGMVKSEKKSISSAKNGADTRPHVVKVSHFEEHFSHALENNEWKFKIPMVINGKKTTYNPDYWCEKLGCWIECATSRGNISEQNKKWKEAIFLGHPLKIFWWDCTEITQQIIDY